MMRLHPIEALLIVLLALGIALHLISRSEFGERNFEFMPNMAENPGYEAQDPNPHFADGRTLRPPVPGTVARGRMPLMHEGRLLDVTTRAWKDLSPDQQTAWDALTDPTDWKALSPEDRASALDRGRMVFESICSACHTKDATGGAQATKRGVPPPPNLVDPKMRERSDGRMVRAITAGEGNMPPHAHQVSRTDRWLVVRHLRMLQGGKE